MRQLIIDMGDLFKKERTAKINEYVLEQFSRVVLMNDTAVSLHDVSERDIYCAVQDVTEKLSLSFAQLQKHVRLVPGVDRKRNMLTAIPEVAPSYFKELLSESGFIKIDDEVVLLSTDDHVVTGSNAHVEFNKNPRTADSAIMAACINLTVSGQPNSCGIGFSELDSIQASYIDIKYGGVNAFSESEWDEVFLACVYRRLLKDDALIMGLSKLQGSIYERYHAAIEHHSGYFKKQQEADNIVRNAFGSVIGRKVQLFTAEELAREMQRDKVSTKVIPFSRGVDTCHHETLQPTPMGTDELTHEVTNDGTDALARAMAGDFSYLENVDLQSNDDLHSGDFVFEGGFAD